MGGNTASAMPSPVIVAATAKHTATVIFLHGLGDTGLGWSSVFEAIRQPHIKYICPTAPVIPVTLNGGMRMTAWFDLCSLDPNGREDESGIKAAAEGIHRLIADEEKAGISSDRIVLGGFSMGGALALYSGLRYPKPLAGILGLSCWLPLFKHFPANSKQHELLHPQAGASPEKGKTKQAAHSAVPPTSKEAEESAIGMIGRLFSSIAGKKEEKGVTKRAEKLPQCQTSNEANSSIKRFEKLSPTRTCKGVAKSVTKETGEFSRSQVCEEEDKEELNLCQTCEENDPEVGHPTMAVQPGIEKSVLEETLAAVGNHDTPIMMCHGDCDDLVPMRWGQLTADLLKTFVKDVTFRQYKGMGHSSCEEETQDIAAYLQSRLPPRPE